MFDLCPGDLPTVLSRASDHPEAIWRLWRYSAAGQVLVLCGYRPLFDRIGYLLFRKPVALRMPWLIAGARFTLGEDASADTGLAPSADPDSSAVRRVAIVSDRGVYQVLCEEVSFYQATSPSKGASHV